MGGSNPNSDFFFFFFSVFCVVFMFPNVSKNKTKNWIGGEWVASQQSEFFSDFFILFNLTRPLRCFISGIICVFL